MKIQTFSDIEFNGKITKEDFNNQLKKFDFISSLMSLQNLSTLMANQIMVNVNLEYEFHVTPKIKNRAGMLSRDFISFCSKQILLNCGSSKINYNDLDLANLIYCYGNFETDLDYTVLNSENAWLWPIRATNQQWTYLRLYSSIIARYKYLFNVIMEDDLAFADKLNKALGQKILDIMKIGTCIYANFCPRKDGKFANSFQISSYTKTSIENLKPLLSEENILKFLNIFSISQDDFKKQSEDFQLDDELLKKYEFNLLRRFPVIKTEAQEENKKYIIPSLADFVYACFEGLYYVLLDKLDSGDKNIFFQKIGFSFEKYIGDLIKYNNLDVFSRSKIYTEQKYKVNGSEWKSADWLLVSNDNIVQIECKKRKLDTYSKAGLQNGDKCGIDSFFSGIAKELDKLINKSEHIKNNKLDELKYKNQRIVNIIVYLDEMFGIDQFAKEQIKNKMENKTDDFYILGCWEFELLCQQSKDKSQNIIESLKDIKNNRTEIYHVDFLDRIYHDFFDDMRG
jgi:hypothetical protein